MATPAELVTIIRFSLISYPRNGQHEFESLCRQVARLRICSNVLPATGPVGAGGDQGRDFETFRTYLAQTPELSAFAARATDETLAFACTLQQEDIGSKIVGDVKKITAEGTPVDAVYAFTEVSVPVGDRHRYQARVRSEFGVRLEVIDGAGIAELLSDPDVFWVAKQYLDLPAEVAPELDRNRSA